MGARSFKANRQLYSATLFKSTESRRNSIQAYSIPQLSEFDYKHLMESTEFRRSEIKSLFSKFTKESKDGELSHDEFVKFYKRLSSETPEFLNENSKFIFDSFDQDHNGKGIFNF